MKRYVFLIIMLFAVAVFFSLQTTQTTRVCFPQRQCVQVEIADTPLKRQQGLMHRAQLEENAGMLFIFSHGGTYSFWMKNTLIPLDIIWITSDLEIVDIQTAVPCETDPCPNYTPRAEARYVLEVNANFTNEHNINIGDTIELN